MILIHGALYNMYCPTLNSSSYCTVLVCYLSITQAYVEKNTEEASGLQATGTPVLQATPETENLDLEAAFPTMDYNRTVLLWIATGLFFSIFIASIWYWFYLHYHQEERSNRLLAQTNGHHSQNTQPQAAQQQGYLGPAAQMDCGSYELETFHENTRWKTRIERGEAGPVTAPSRSAARNDWGGYHPDQVHTKIIPPLNMKGLDHSHHLERDQKAIKLATDERRHYSVTNSDSSGTPQMTPKTGSSAAQTPDGQRTPLPRYILEHFDRDPPAYAESEPSRHAARPPPRRPTF